jgi:hypothetical protein
LQLLDVPEQLHAKPALPNSRLTHHGDQLARLLLHGPLERRDQQRALEVPTNQRRRM